MGNPISVQSGQFIIDHSVVPYARSREIEFFAHDLKPFSNASFFLDDVNVNQFIQPASVLNTNIGISSNAFHQGEGLYCNTTHAYCTIIGTSQSNVLYVNENYISLNLTPYGPNNSNTFTSSSYNVGDLVYQTTANVANVIANTFLGTVAYWNSVDKSLAVKVKNGFPTNTSPVVFKIGSNQLANVANGAQLVYGNKFPVGATVTATDNNSLQFLVSGWVNNGGPLANNSSNVNQLNITALLPNTSVNSLVQIMTGSGMGQNSKINGLVGNNTLSLNTAFSFPAFTTGSGPAYYGVGNVVIDAVGLAAGIFQLPEDQNIKFLTGNRLFTINDGVSYDDAQASMRAIAIYAATGEIYPSNTTAQTPVVTQTPTMVAAANNIVAPKSITQSALTFDVAGSNNPQAAPNPLAQTFMVPNPAIIKQNYGIFVTSVDLFFQNKPSGNSTQFPVTVMIVSVDNGFPTSDVLASATVEWADINVVSGTQGVFPDFANNSTLTKFSFDDPVYLAPSTEYAIVIYTETPDYQVWVSQLGEEMINSTRLVSDQPFVGDFFEAQNSSAWNPIKGTMLMFILNKAQFSTSSQSILTFNVKAPVQNTLMDMSLLHSTDLTFPVANLTYSMSTTIANTGAADASFFSINPNDVHNFGSDLKTSSISSARRRVVLAGNSNSTKLQVTLATNDPDVSPIFNTERLSLFAVTNLINDGSIDFTDISITSPGSHINANNIVVTISAPTGDNGIQATANILPSQMVANSVIGINMINPGAGYIVSPTITLAEAGAPGNATAIIYGEDKLFGGNGQTRYITRPITLADGFDAGDLAVFMDAVRPAGTDIQVYYKVLSAQDTDVLANKPWIPMVKAVDILSPDQSTSVSMEFVTGISGTLSYIINGITYPLGGKFKTFALKIVLFADDPTVPPLIQDWHAICVPAG